MMDGGRYVTRATGPRETISRSAMACAYYALRCRTELFGAAKLQWPASRVRRFPPTETLSMRCARIKTFQRGRNEAMTANRRVGLDIRRLSPTKWEQAFLILATIWG